MDAALARPSAYRPVSLCSTDVRIHCLRAKHRYLNTFETISTSVADGDVVTAARSLYDLVDSQFQGSSPAKRPSSAAAGAERNLLIPGKPQ